MGDESQHATHHKTSIAPMLSVRNGAKAIDFYKTAFGAGELFRLDDPSGAVVAQLSVGDCNFWLADESPEHSNFSPETLGGATARMVMVVDDPDTAFVRAIAAGSHRGPACRRPALWLARRTNRRSFRTSLGNWQAPGRRRLIKLGAKLE